MGDYHTKQLTGSACGPYNCAACAASDALAAVGGPQLTGDQFRAVAGVSCVPGAHSPSGGLYISDVERVFKHYGKTIDYGRDSGHPLPVHWTTAQGTTKIKAGMGGVILGDYDALPHQYRAPGSTFLGDHSAYIHDYRVDGTVCWHDPLRTTVIRIPWSAVVKYWQKPGSAVRGLAGWVTLPKPPKPKPPTPAPPTGKHSLLISANAVVRIYKLKPIKGQNACIVSWTDQKWGPKASSAPCSAPAHRETCDGKSGATTVRITSGVFKNKTVRVGSGTKVVDR